MPSILDALTDRLRTLNRRSSVRSSTRRSIKRSNSVLSPQYTTTNEKKLANAPPETPTTTMPQPYMSDQNEEITNESIQAKYATLQRSATLASGVSLEGEPKNFWEIKGYKSALHRCDDGYELGNKLVECLMDRARLEEAYAKSLKQWNKKWSDYLNLQKVEYETGKDAWLAMLKTGDDVAAIHTDLCEKIQKTPVSTLKTWLKDKYQKHVINFRQRKEFETDFERAQNSWLKTIEKMKQRKKEYYQCIRKERAALTNANITRANIDKTEDQKKKADQEHERAKIETDRAEKSYKDEIEKLNLYKPTYEKEMRIVFDQTNKFEESRKKKFEEIYRECQVLLKQQVDEQQYKTIFDNFFSAIQKINHKHDIEWWSHQYGADMELIVPQFEPFTGK